MEPIFNITVVFLSTLTCTCSCTCSFVLLSGFIAYFLSEDVDVAHAVTLNLILAQLIQFFTFSLLQIFDVYILFDDICKFVRGANFNFSTFNFQFSSSSVLSCFIFPVLHAFSFQVVLFDFHFFTFSDVVRP